MSKGTIQRLEIERWKDGDRRITRVGNEIDNERGNEIER